jgi:hypothetical protein
MQWEQFHAGRVASRGFTGAADAVMCGDKAVRVLTPLRWEIHSGRNPVLDPCKRMACRSGDLVSTCFPRREIYHIVAVSATTCH